MSRKPFLALAVLGLALLSLAPQSARAQAKPVLTTLHRFDDAHGVRSTATLTLARDGNFYGVTSAGGSQNYGTVFSITPAGKFTTLHNFDGTHDGGDPQSALTLGADGALYGVAQFEGKKGFGTAFRITTSGAFSVLHTFGGAEGFYPFGSLTLAPDGLLYGTAVNGGAGYNVGTVFSLTPAGKATALHIFTGPDGEFPQGALVVGPDGALYGTASRDTVQYAGNVFRITTGGAFSVLHTFVKSDGQGPFAGLTPGTDGALYGVTALGGYKDGGVAYKITPSGTFTLLHKFRTVSNGVNPFSALTLGADGLFYGTTYQGGANSKGTVFSLTPAGIVTPLYKFHTAFDGAGPYGGVVFGLDGALYGTTFSGGTKSGGTLYKLTLPVAN